MRTAAVICFLLVAAVAVAGIPDPKIYRWGKIEVPENYSQPEGRKIEIYWEKITSTNPQPQAIVLINGGPGNSHESFHKFNEQGGFEKDYFLGLRDHFEVYYFDQRGTGNSSGLSFRKLGDADLHQFGTTNICRDIEELRRQVIKQERIAVFGESYGGMVALSYAVLFPDAVSRLVIHDSSPSNRYFTHLYQNFSNALARLDSSEFPGIRANFRKTLKRFAEGTVTAPGKKALTPNDFLSKCLVFTYSFRGLTVMARMVKEIAETGHSKVLNAVMAPEGTQSADTQEKSAGPSPTLLSIQALEMLDENEVSRLEGAAAYDPWNFGWSQEKMFQPRRQFKQDAQLEGFEGYDVISRLSTIKAPALVIVGKCDFVCPPDHARIIQKGIGNQCQLLQIDQAAHGAFDEKEEYTVGAIRAFLLPGIQCADIAPPPRVNGDEVAKTLRYRDIIDSYVEGTRRMRGLLGH